MIVLMLLVLVQKYVSHMPDLRATIGSRAPTTQICLALRVADSPMAESLCLCRTTLCLSPLEVDTLASSKCQYSFSANSFMT